MTENTNQKILKHKNLYNNMTENTNQKILKHKNLYNMTENTNQKILKHKNLYNNMTENTNQKTFFLNNIHLKKKESKHIYSKNIMNTKFFNKNALEQLTKDQLINMLLKPHIVSNKNKIKQMKNEKQINKQKQNKNQMLNELKQNNTIYINQKQNKNKMLNQLKQHANIKQKVIHYNKLGVNLTDLRNSERKLANTSDNNKSFTELYKKRTNNNFNKKKCQ